MLEITRDKWKGKLARKPAQTQALHSNMVEGGAEYCSVTTVLFLLRYYDLHRITTGPVFRAFTLCRKTGKKIPVHATYAQPDQTIRGSGGKRTRY